MKKLALTIILFISCITFSFSQKSEVIHLNKADFLTKVFNYEKNTSKWVYEGKKPCIIDFYADWCGPCRKVAPVLSDIATKYKDKIIVYKIDTDKEQELAQAFGISSIPTLLFIPMNDSPQVVRGAIEKEDFEKIINQVLLKNKNKKTALK